MDPFLTDVTLNCTVFFAHCFATDSTGKFNHRKGGGDVVCNLVTKKNYLKIIHTFNQSMYLFQEQQVNNICNREIINAKYTKSTFNIIKSINQ